MADKTLMIDTTVLIDYFRKTDKPKAKLVQLSEQYERLVISSVTEFEVYSGATPAQLSFWQELLSEIVNTQTVSGNRKTTHARNDFN